MRNAFLNSYLPKARTYGLEIPDEPRIRENDDGTYDVVEDDLDWDEFFRIAKNDYEPGVGQIDARKQAQEAVEWVRDVLDDREALAAGGRSQQAAD